MKRILMQKTLNFNELLRKFNVLLQKLIITSFRFNIYVDKSSTLH